jgi:hypothetical protein
MFERGWALYLSGNKDEALAVFGRALWDAERAAGVPEGYRSLRVAPPSALEATYVVGDRVLVSTPFMALLAESSTGRVERVVRDLRTPQVIRGTSLIIDQQGEVRTRILDGQTLAPIVAWEGRALVRQSADGALLAVGVADGKGDPREHKIVVFDTRERRTIVEIPVPELDGQARFVDEGRILVNGGEVRDARSGRLLFSQSNVVGSPAFATSYVAFVASDGAVALAERDTWKPIAKTRACAAAGPLAFDSNGKWLAIGGADTACLVEVPSLRVRRSHVGRRLPIFQHPELERPLINRTIPTFVGNGRVLALTSFRTSEVSLFDATTGRELSHDVGELYVPENSDAYVVAGNGPREKITVGSTGTIERRTLAQDEYTRLWRGWAHVPAPEIVDRVRANLCVLDWGSIDWGRGNKPGYWIVPREACRR